MKEQHLLVDYENVHSTIEDLLKLAPKLTDVWLFHGPGQINSAEQVKAKHERVTLVPHSGKGKNALDFHLSFYLGYVAARHPQASLMVVANDKGYDSMIGHAKDLGFTAQRVGFKAKKAVATKKKAATTSAKKTAPTRKKAVAAASAPAATASATSATAPSKAVPGKKAAKKVTVAKNAVAPMTAPMAPAAPKLAAKAGPSPAPAVKRTPAKTDSAKKVVVKKAPSKKVPAKKPAAPVVPKVSDGGKAFARAKIALGKMDKNRPTKVTALLRFLKSMVGQGATVAEADALSQRLQHGQVIQVAGDTVLYP